MNGQGAPAALLGAGIVLALLVIRTAVREMKEPGSARHEWTFLRERRGPVTFLATASVLSAVSWTIPARSTCPGWASLPCS
ncbi:hypothetical protein [Streptomyces sp. NBC_01744]|uniref:hypothetical protein n=1 Tax=Streptomyces sp. NBC_01744 TaxID=2975927 RepID=UPI003D9A2927|nr:hypothetical protein OIE70_37005 [Streptomyces sp. NBC_01744]